MRMREKIARALCVADGHDPDEHVFGNQSAGFEDYGPRWNAYQQSGGQLGCISDYAGLADAVLDAMMTPDEGMARAAQTAVVARGEGDCITLDAMRDAWKAMLLAAKSPRAGGG